MMARVKVLFHLYLVGVIFAVMVDSISLRRVMCPMLPDPLHGTVTQSDGSYPLSINQKCNKGYTNQDSKTTTRVCQQNNTWSGEEIKCEAVMCPTMLNPPHGRVLPHETSYLAKAKVQCEEGYIYNKPNFSTRQCQGDNTWSGEAGNCTELACPALPEVKNGVLLPSGGAHKLKVTLQCYSGHTLDGLVSVWCEANGTWSDSLGLCSKTKAQYNWLYTALTFLLIAVLVGVIGLFIFIQCRKKAHRYESIYLTTEGSTQMLCIRFSFREDFTDEFTDRMSAEYAVFVEVIEENIEEALRQMDGFEVESLHIRVTHISKERKQVTVRISSSGLLKEDEVCEAMGEVLCQSKERDARTFTIDPASIVYTDAVTDALKQQILHEKHMLDTKWDTRINLSTQYVKLRLISCDGMQTVQRDELEVLDRYQASLEKSGGDEIDEDHLVQDGTCGKYIILRGRAGIGKSTLIQMLFWKWAHGESGDHIYAIFLFNMRFLADIKRKMDLPTLLGLNTQLITGNDTPVVPVPIGWIKDNEKNIAIILDGLDEIHDFRKHWEDEGKGKLCVESSATPFDWLLSLLKRHTLSNSMLIISSRPFPDLSLLKQSMITELIGLTRKGVFEFIKKNVRKADYNRVKQTLVKNPILLSVSAITFYCAALCKVLKEQDELPDMSTYTEITAFILEKYITRSVKNENGNQGEEARKLPNLENLSILAYNGLITNEGKGPSQLIFSEEDFRIAHIDDTAMDQLRKAGLLLQTRTQDQEDPAYCQVYSQFVHLSVQEFMAAGGLLQQQYEQLREKLTMLIESGQFNNVLLFLYGLAFNGNSVSTTAPNLWQLWLQHVSAEIRELLADVLKDVMDDLQVLQMVHESQSEDLAYRLGTERFSKQIKFEGTKLTVIDVMAITFLLKQTPSADTLQLKNVGLDLTSIKEVSKFLGENKTIKNLNIVDGSINDEWIRELMKGINKNKGLQTLQLSSSHLTHSGVGHVAGVLMENCPIDELWLHGLQLDDKGAEAILEALKFNVNICIWIASVNCSKNFTTLIEEHEKITILAPRGCGT